MLSFLDIWQDLPTYFQPIAWQIGPLALRWYSLSYLLAFFTIYFLWQRQAKKMPPSAWQALAPGLFSVTAKTGRRESLNRQRAKVLDAVEKVLFFAFLGAILGGRLGYALFYDHSLLNFALFWPFDATGDFRGLAGMSFHGGLIGALLLGGLVARFYRLNIFCLTNYLLPLFPLGYFWGRLGNFLNQELLGRPADGFPGMYFPGHKQLLHPSPLYEALGEGLLLYFILRYLTGKYGFNQTIFYFLIFYGLIRFLLEFWRQPDAQLGFIAFGWLTMGQLLCLLMFFSGLFGLLFSRRFIQTNCPPIAK